MQKKLLIIVGALIAVGLAYGNFTQKRVWRNVEMDHTTIDFSTLGPWTVTWERSDWGGGPFCRAVGSPSTKTEITILAYLNNDRGGHWYYSVIDYRLSLPEHTKRPAESASEGATSSIGEVRDIGWLTGGQRISSGAMFEFPQADNTIPAIRQGKVLTVRGDAKLFPDFKLPIDAAIIQELDRCVARGGPK